MGQVTKQASSTEGKVQPTNHTFELARSFLGDKRALVLYRVTRLDGRQFYTIQMREGRKASRPLFFSKLSTAVTHLEWMTTAFDSTKGGV